MLLFQLYPKEDASKIVEEEPVEMFGPGYTYSEQGDACPFADNTLENDLAGCS